MDDTEENCSLNSEPEMDLSSDSPNTVVGIPNAATASINAPAAETPPAVETAPAAVTAPAAPPPKRQRQANADGNRRRSRAWEHFNPLPASEFPTPTAACKHCHKKYLCGSKSHGTSTLLAHIDVCPQNPLALHNNPTQTTLAFGEGSSLGVASTRFNVEACRKALAIFVIADEQPFRSVEGEGFRNLCKQLQPQFTIPSRRSVARDCLKLYLEEKVKLKAFFKSDCRSVALTTDCWTSLSNLNFMTLTAHFIDNDWKYQKRIISFSPVPNHKGETLGKKIEEVLREWGLRNVSTITVDNASSNDVCLAYLKRRLKTMNGLVMDGQYLHVRCCAHVLNLVVEEGLKDHHLSIASVRNAVRFVRSSPSRTAKFKECVSFAGITCKKLLCLDVSTRWNTSYLMLDSAEKYEAAFEKLIDEDPSYKDSFGDAGPPTSEDWENVRAFVRFLKFFYDATKLFSASQQVSIHTAFHQMSAIQCELNASSLNLNTVLAVMAKDMQKKYDKYWGNVATINQLLYFGVILDPRYKMRYMKWSLEGMYAGNPDFATRLLNSISANLSKMFFWYKQAFENQNRNAPPSFDASTAGSLSQAHAFAEITSQLARTDLFKQHLKEKDSVDRRNELEKYLEEDNQDDNKFDLLLWWKTNSAQYPILSNMVRDLMATPVSTVASESAFSTGGRVIDTFRTSLNPQMAEALICSQNWLRPSFFQFNDLNEEYEISESVVTTFNGAPAPVGAAAQTPPFGGV